MYYLNGGVEQMRANRSNRAWGVRSPRIRSVRDLQQPYWMLNESEEAELGGFKFKKIFKKVTKFALPILAPITLLPKLIKPAGKLLKGVGRVAGSLVKGVAGGFAAGGPGAEYPGAGLQPYGQPGDPYGPGSSYGPSEGGLLGGMSPMTIGLIAGVPLVLLLLMRDRK